METNTAQEIDPLSGAAGGIEPPKYPVLMPDRLVQFEIKKATVDDVKDKPGRQTLAIVLATTKPTTATDGVTLQPGFKTTHRIGLTPSETEGKRPRTWTNIRQDLGVLLRASGLADKEPKEIVGSPGSDGKLTGGRPELLEGRIIEATTGIQKAQGTFPESTTVRIKDV